MAFDPFAEEQTRPKPRGHAVGEDLALLSVDEIDERINLLRQEIQRLEEVRAQKEASKAAASAFFKTA
ncbi:MAG TPA: DUF1192 domain-containing protein [Microvirga sp.]|jgi:uncharacterized small protein (DUF1192 family)